jgi:hypothetical protein
MPQQAGMDDLGLDAVLGQHAQVPPADRRRMEVTKQVA